jgi:hypothetical protein
LSWGFDVRRKVSAPHKEFVKSIDSLLELDQKNQSRLTTNPGRTPTGFISQKQLNLLTEGVFLSAYRDFERFLEDVFILYTQSKPTLSNRKPHSFLKPRDFDHAYEIIKSGRDYLDWTNPTFVIDRSEIFLKDGEPIKLSFTSNQAELKRMKDIRNHIAHNSPKSLTQYQKVVRHVYGTVPLKTPPPGELLLKMVPRSSPPQHYLIFYLEILTTIASDITR